MPFLIYSLRIAVLATVAVMTLVAASLYALPGFRLWLAESAMGAAGLLAAIAGGTLLIAFATAWTAMLIREHRHAHWSHIETPHRR